MEITLYKSFTTDPSQGNPAGVIANAENLSAEHMTAIAAELGFSESAFLSAVQNSEARVRFFSPQQEVPFCGHAVLAAAAHLMARQQSNACTLHSQNTSTQFTQQHNTISFALEPSEFLGLYTAKQIAPLLGLNPENLHETWPIELVSVGVPKLIIPLKGIDQLSAIIPDLPGMTKLCQRSAVCGFYPVAKTDEGFQARQFNPAAGINEDPITGVAAGALGAYAQKYRLTKGDTIIVEQGQHLNQAGQITVTLTEPVSIGGACAAFA